MEALEALEELNPDFDPEAEEDFDDNEYIICKNGIV